MLFYLFQKNGACLYLLNIYRKCYQLVFRYIAGPDKRNLAYVSCTTGRSALQDTENRSIQELLTEAEHRHTADYAAQGFVQLRRKSQRSLPYTIRGQITCVIQLCQPLLPSCLADCPVHPGKLPNHISLGIIAVMKIQHATVLKDAITSKKKQLYNQLCLGNTAAEPQRTLA